MKKIILLLAALALYASAFTCLDAMPSGLFGATISTKLKGTYILDSTVSSAYVAMFHYDITNAIDTLIKCNSSNQCKKYPYKEVSSNVGNTTVTEVYIEEHLEYVQTVYPNDSMVTIQYSDATDTDRDTNGMTINYTRNDTTYDNTYEYHENQFELSDSYFIVLDSTDNHKCYDYTTMESGSTTNNTDTPSSIIWMDLTDETLILYTGKSTENYTLKFHYSKISANDNTSITRKVHPAIINKQYHYFDLMGRPAKGKNTIKVVK